MNVWNIPYSQKQVEKLVFLWYNKILEKVKPRSGNKYFSFCSNTVAIDNDFFFMLTIILIIIFICLGSYYCQEYYKRKRYYQQLISNNNDD